MFENFATWYTPGYRVVLLFLLSAVLFTGISISKQVAWFRNWYQTSFMDCGLYTVHLHKVTYEYMRTENLK